MKSRIGRLFVYITYPILVFAIVVLGTLLFLENRKVNELNTTFEDARKSLNKENQNQQVTIEDLSAEFQEQSQRIADLTAENNTLKQQVAKLEQTGLSTISGKVLPFITDNTNGFSQYQRVCAESIADNDLQYCKTVSAIQQEFDLYVEPGKYRVYAEIFPQPKDSTTALYGVKTYFTEYIQCVNSKPDNECNKAKLTKPVTIELTSGQTLSDINPIDWR